VIIRARENAIHPPIMTRFDRFIATVNCFSTFVLAALTLGYLIVTERLRQLSESQTDLYWRQHELNLAPVLLVGTANKTDLIKQTTPDRILESRKRPTVWQLFAQ
jgi:hypothetical protein